MSSNIQKIQGQGECLQRVTGFFRFYESPQEEAMLVALTLEFESLGVSLYIEGDDSVLLVDPKSLLLEGACRALDLSSTVWKAAIGLPLIWVWVLKNQQGYEDGIQLEFAKSAASEPILLQMLGVAGEIKIRSIPPDFEKFV